MNRPLMVFHVPFPLNPNATSASGIRPVSMRKAFERIGYEVLEVSGYHHERKAKMRAVKEAIRTGASIEFVYSEAATTPTGLGEKITRHTSLTRDIRFLKSLKQQGIPVGLFYRDVYWQFEEYVTRVKQPYAAVLRARYRADLRGYRDAVTKIFLPSQRMAEFLPEANRPQCVPLPPGAKLGDFPVENREVGLLYVGGTNDYYRMHEAVAGVQQSESASLTICTRDSEWEASRHSYRDVLGERTRVLHKSGKELEELYSNAHIGMLFMEPIGYRDFAAPLKLYEYLGNGKPVIATEGSLAAEFIAEEGFGWVLPYNREKLAELLDELAADPERLREKTEQAINVRQRHTWEARAEQARDVLLRSV